MSAKAFLFAIAAGVIGGCAQMPGMAPLSAPPGATILDCSTPACTVKVSVKCEAYVFCWIETDNDWIKVRRGNAPVITWEIVTSGYTFSDAGISFPSGSPFTCNPAEGKRRFMCNDRHSEPGTYKYTVTLIGFPFVLPKDPFVSNE